MGSRPSLQRLIAMPAEDFLSGYYSRMPVVSRQSELHQGFDDLLTESDVDRLLCGGLRTSSVRMVRGDQQARPEQFGRPAVGDDAGTAPYIDTTRVMRLLQDGYSLVLRSLHRYHSPLVTFGHDLAGELGYPVRISAYVTPPNSQAVRTHFDLQDVFVLQIQGAKEWNILKPAVELPVEGQAWQEMGRAKRERFLEEAEPSVELTLTPGDVLYVPRGYLHDAKASTETSIQLTVAVVTLSRFDLFRQLAERASQDKWFREALPLYSDNSEISSEMPELLSEGFRRLERLAAEAPCDDLIWELRRDQSRDLPPAPVSVLGSLGRGDRTTYISHPGMRFAIRTDGASVRVLLDERELVFPAGSREIIEEILVEGKESETLANHKEPPDLRTRIVRALINSGVLIPKP